jgi:hypothetical protein
VSEWVGEWVSEWLQGRLTLLALALTLALTYSVVAALLSHCFTATAAIARCGGVVSEWVIVCGGFFN